MTTIKDVNPDRQKKEGLNPSLCNKAIEDVDPDRKKKDKVRKAQAIRQRK